MMTWMTARNWALRIRKKRAMQNRFRIRNRTDTIGFGWMTTMSAGMMAMKPMRPDQNSRLASPRYVNARSATATAPSAAPAGSVRAGRNVRTSAKTVTTAIRPRSRYISRPAHQDQERHPQDVRQADRQQSLPAQVHELIVAEARHGPAHPDVHEQEERDLRAEGQDLHDRRGGLGQAEARQPGHVVAAEVQRHR